MTTTAEGPFGVVTSLDGRYVFVSGSSGLAVYTVGEAEAGHIPHLSLVRTVPVQGEALGDALTPDGLYLLVAIGDGAAVFDVAKLEHGGGGALAGTLRQRGSEGIEVAVSPDGRYAFVSFEDSSDVGVFDLRLALQSGFSARGVAIGAVRVGLAPVGMAVSADGKWLYVTSEEDSSVGASSAHGVDCGAGSLSVIALASAERHPATTGRIVAPAGQTPVRVVLADGGAVAWVTARGSDALLAFSTARLTSASKGHVTTGALVAVVPVGVAPVGVIVVLGGQFVVVADSNRFFGSGPQWLSVVDVRAALEGRSSLVGKIRAGSFPRQLAESPDGSTLYITNFGSSQLETVGLANFARLPSA
jgi:DNA-binding beta-propeller fold protein YncE